MGLYSLLQGLQALATGSEGPLSPRQVAALALVFARLSHVSSTALEPLKEALRAEALRVGGPSPIPFPVDVPPALHALLGEEEAEALQGGTVAVSLVSPQARVKPGVSLEDLRARIGPEQFNRFFKTSYSLRPGAIEDLKAGLEEDNSAALDILLLLEDVKMTPRVRFPSLRGL